MATSNSEPFSSSPRTHVTQPAFQVCKHRRKTVEIKDSRKREVNRKSRRRRSSGEKKRRREGIPAHKDAEMQSVLAPLRAQKAHVRFQFQTRDATKTKTKRSLVGGDNYRAGLDKRSRTAGAEAQNNPSQQATNWERSRRPCSNSTPLSSSSVHVIFTEGFKSRPWLHLLLCA